MMNLRAAGHADAALEDAVEAFRRQPAWVTVTTL